MPKRSKFAASISIEVEEGSKNIPLEKIEYSVHFGMMKKCFRGYCNWIKASKVDFLFLTKALRGKQVLVVFRKINENNKKLWTLWTLTYHFAIGQAENPEILVHQAAAPTIALSRPEWFYSTEISCSFPAS